MHALARTFFAWDEGNGGLWRPLAFAGNHDLWLTSAERAAGLDSVGKLMKLIDACDELGVHTEAAYVAEFEASGGKEGTPSLPELVAKVRVLHNGLGEGDDQRTFLGELLLTQLPVVVRLGAQPLLELVQLRLARAHLLAQRRLLLPLL